MFKRQHHQRIARLLRKFDAQILREAGARFGGGTAAALLLDEYRESVDVDFMVADKEGYRLLREAVSSQSLGELSNGDITLLRAVKWDRDKISFFAVEDGTPIKVEFVLEGRLDLLKADTFPDAGIPLLAREDMFAEKLLANTDRGLDASTLSRDLIDLAMMIRAWDGLPQGAVDRAVEVYGNSVYRLYEKALAKFEDPEYQRHCLRELQMEPDLGPELARVLREAQPEPDEPGSAPGYGR